MSWLDIVIIALMAFAIYAFLTWSGLQKRLMTRKTGRTAEDMYDSYADSPRKQRRYAREHGGEWRTDDPASPPRGPGNTAS